MAQQPWLAPRKGRPFVSILQLQLQLQLSFSQISFFLSFSSTVPFFKTAFHHLVWSRHANLLVCSLLSFLFISYPQHSEAQICNANLGRCIMKCPHMQTG